MELYETYLIEQYKNARGMKGESVSFSDFKKDFYNWLREYKKNAKSYVALLNLLNINFDNSNTAEVNKGKYDSVVLPYNTTIISPYMNNSVLNNGVNNVIIKKEFTIKRGMPCYEEYEKNIFRYMTHNPYSNCDNIELMNWKYMHEFTTYEIILGMFGNLNDHDREEKIAKLKSIKRYTTIPFVEQYETTNNGYYYVLASSPKRRIK